MIITKNKLNELLAKTIIETARKCGRNLSLKEQAQIKNRIMEGKDKCKK